MISRPFRWIVGVLATVGLPAQHQAGDVDLQPVQIGGAEFAIERGRLWVPENRRRQDSRTIELAFARLKSTADDPGPPLIYLHGGPGGAATPAVRSPQALAMWRPLLALGDVILLDQRGCGASKPPLMRPLTTPPPAEILRTRRAYVAWLVEASAAVKAELQAEGVDFTGYDTEQSADDVDALRAALGAERMRLLGFSYGTHLGLSVIRRHGEHVEAAVLIGVEGPDETAKLPSVYDVQIARLAALVAADPDVGDDVPDFGALLRRVLAKLEREPIVLRVPRPQGVGEAVEVAVGADGLRTILVHDFGDTSDLPVFPRLLWTIDHGDPSVLEWFVRKRYSNARFFPTHAFTTDPASGCPPARAARIEAEAARAVLGNTMNFMFPEVEAVWRMPTLGDDFRAPVVSSVRTLFISGALDANTPPYQAERVRWGFLDATHLVQRYGGHEDWLRNQRAQRAILDFLRGDDVAGRDIDMPPLRFLPVRGKPTGVTHPSVR